MAIKLNKDGSIDKRWKPKDMAEAREAMMYENEYNRKKLEAELEKSRKAARTAMANAKAAIENARKKAKK